MKKSIIIDRELIEKIVESFKISEQEKLKWLKIIGYLTLSERRELKTLI
ncbi:MAG: hypothetical protein Q9M94_06555 [Candidatus Gracilibacteria bacterium]|nr:hypothetical protein [Candidatus Gracilibacteria bacterium]MDQ7022969.1 hypothetical protein [Candidatus Gracilibacteria bacterium]